MSNEQVPSNEIKCENSFRSLFQLKCSYIFAICAFLLLLILLFLFLSFKYQLTSTDGNIYRINKITGDVQLIQGTRFVKIDSVGHASTLRLSKFRKLDEITIPKHNLKCNLDILWRNDDLYYNFNVSPYNDSLKRIREGGYFESLNKGFNIELYDANGFVIAQIPVKISDMTGVVDDNNRPTELSMKGKTHLSYEDMKLLKNWSTTWNF